MKKMPFLFLFPPYFIFFNHTKYEKNSKEFGGGDFIMFQREQKIVAPM